MKIENRAPHIPPEGKLAEKRAYVKLHAYASYTLCDTTTSKFEDRPAYAQVATAGFPLPPLPFPNCEIEGLANHSKIEDRKTKIGTDHLRNCESEYSAGDCFELPLATLAMTYSFSAC